MSIASADIRPQVALRRVFSWAFGAVVQDVVAWDPLVRVEVAVLRVAVLRFLHSQGGPYLTRICSMLVGSITNFLLLRFLVFRLEKGG